MRLVGILLAGLVVFLSGPLAAQDEMRLYHISDVAVDLTVDQVAKARDAALEDAERTAFSQLMTRLSVAQPVQTPDGAHLAGLVSSFEIQKEHIAGKRYIGTFSIQFQPEKIRAFLQEGGHSFREAQPVKLLILPVSKEGERYVLWEDMTPWRSAWIERARSGDLVSLLMPEGDLQDVALISSREAAQGESQKILALLHKYNVDGVVVAQYPVSSDQGQERVQLTRFDKNGKRYEPLSFEAGWTEEGKEAEKPSLQSLVNAAIQSIESQHVTPPVEVPSMPSSPVETTTGTVGHVLSARVPVQTLAEWATLRRKLEQVEGIKDITVNSMSRGLVQIQLGSSKDFPELNYVMAQNGLYMVLTGNGQWEIRLLPQQ